MKPKIIFIILLFLAFLFFFGLYFPKDPFSSKKVYFEIEKNETASEIAERLEKEGIIRKKIFFEIYVLLKKREKQLKSGLYKLSPSMSIPKIVEKLVKGNSIKKTITIPEGWTLRDIGNYLEKKKVCKAQDFWKITGESGKIYPNDSLPDLSSQFPFLKQKPKNISLEGFLFPDTYEVVKGESCKEIIIKMLKNFQKKVLPLEKEIQKQKKSLFEVLIMASLLEKEVKTKKDKEIVSGILWKRLKSKIPLQVDATITYITNKKTLKISKKDLQIASPYNTYLKKGLPIGPISNPGLDSILAALYPKESEFWYYLSTPEGKTIFSKTLKEHNIAKRKYLK